MSERLKRGNSLVSHPFRQWYNDQIMTGRPINEIYSKQTTEGKIPIELHVSKRTIAEYRNNIFKPNNEIVKQYKEEKQKALEETIHQELIQQPETKTAIAEKKMLLIDAEATFLDMHASIKKQLIHLASIEDPSIRERIGIAETVGKICDNQRLIILDYLKMQGQLKDTPQTQINIINIEKNNAEMDALKFAIKEILTQLDPTLLPVFFNLLKEKIEPITKAFELKQQNLSNAGVDEDLAGQTIQTFISKATNGLDF